MNPGQKKAHGDAGKRAHDPIGAQPADDLAQRVAAAQQHDDEIGALRQEIDELKKQMIAFKEAASRAQAELQNAKLRMEREAVDLRKFASEMTLLRLLPTIDNFQRAFKHLPADLSSHEWVKGMQATEQELMRQLNDLGLKKMDAVGQVVDGHRHEVLMEGEGEKGKVIEVFEDGYELHGKVLRPAKVKVGFGNTTESKSA